MASPKQTLRMSSKGQVVLPVDVRRELGLASGRELRIRRQGRSIILTPVEASDLSVEDALEKLRSASSSFGRDLVEELHARRREEREGR
jgi:AbrB family looped-hinge helix DNA binding protein